MTKIGTKIKEARKKKGLSQEELAESAKINLRTVQRIENNENEPRGITLNLISKALEIDMEEIHIPEKETNTKYLFRFHLSVLSCIIIPAGNLIFPVIMWLSKKDKIEGLKESGVNLLNFQISWTILASVAGLGYSFFRIQHYPTDIPVYTLLILYVINIILPIAFALEVKKGKVIKAYPSIFKFIS